MLLTCFFISFWELIVSRSCLYDFKNYCMIPKVNFSYSFLLHNWLESFCSFVMHFCFRKFDMTLEMKDSDTWKFTSFTKTISCSNQECVFHFLTSDLQINAFEGVGESFRRAFLRPFFPLSNKSNKNVTKII